MIIGMVDYKFGYPSYAVPSVAKHSAIAKYSYSAIADIHSAAAERFQLSLNEYQR